MPLCRVLVCSPVWPGIHDPSAPASAMLRVTNQYHRHWCLSACQSVNLSQGPLYTVHCTLQCKVGAQGSGDSLQTRLLRDGLGVSLQGGFGELAKAEVVPQKTRISSRRG